jgi:hypothetical protein
MSQRDQGMAVLGEDQGIDLCVGEIVEQMASVIGGCGNGDGGRKRPSSLAMAAARRRAPCQRPQTVMV